MKKVILISTIFCLFLAGPALAQTSFSIEDIGSSVGLGSTDLKDTIINIIQWVLGILALVAVVMIISAGFVAATAQGEERGEKAKKVIIGAIVGLIVVLLAWAVVIFVAGTTANVTQ
ncbi:Mbov_0395 family pilin-like conjugal transfer protein [Patescibacteria group bacterium]